MQSQKKIAIVADWLTDRGGAEKVVLSLCDLYPEAQIFTSVFLAKNFPELKKHKIQQSFLRFLPNFIKKKHQFLLLFYPLAFKLFDLSKFDLVITSVSSGFAKCVKTKKTKQIHVCYCHSPVRFLYHEKEHYLKNYYLPWVLRWVKLFLPPVLWWLRTIDQKSAKQVDFFVTNSHFTADRIKQIYRRQAEVIYPGGGEIFSRIPLVQKKGDFFLAAGRMVPYKNFPIIAEVFAKNKLNLKLVGNGPDKHKCQKITRKFTAKNITFLDFLPETEFAQLLSRTRALIFLSKEDFGITVVNSELAGTPIIYLQSGGATEIVSENSGVPIFSPETIQVQKAIDNFIKKESEFDSKEIRREGMRFTERKFRENFEKFIEKKVSFNYSKNR